MCEADDTPDLTQLEKELQSRGITTTVQDRVLLREACVNISTRAARISAMGIASLLQLEVHHAAPGTTVAIDGSVFELYPCFKERIEVGLEELLGVDRAHGIKLVLAKDGSGVGAAIIAASAGQ